MKANELMIGDWVYIKSDIDPDAYWLHDMQPGQALKVTEILSNSINPAWYDGEISDCVPEDAIEHIPITPEILEKNGFKKYGDTGWWLKDDYYDVQIYEWSDSIWVARYESNEMDCPHEQLTMSYIHELQHFLKAVGIEKEMTI